MAQRDIIVLGASAGGVEALSALVRGLPSSLPAALFVVCHFPPGGRSVLPEILSRQGPLLARLVRDGDPIYPGHIYVAPPDHHLVVEVGRVRLTRGARENHFRPAIDPLFRSAARAYGRRVIGVLLSGVLHDGIAGLLAVRGGGGVAVVQDPHDALLAALPRTASEMVGADHVVSARDMAPLLARLVQQPSVPEGESTVDDPIDRAMDTMTRDMAAQEHGDRRGALSTFTCPECGGSLWQVDEQPLVRFRCHVGHAYAGEVLLAEQSAALEAALWTAVRTFREKSVLARQLARRLTGEGNPESAARFEDDARLADRYSELIQKYLLGVGDGDGEVAPLPTPEPAAAPAEDAAKV